MSGLRLVKQIQREELDFRRHRGTDTARYLVLAFAVDVSQFGGFPLGRPHRIRSPGPFAAGLGRDPQVGLDGKSVQSGPEQAAGADGAGAHARPLLRSDRGLRRNCHWAIRIPSCSACSRCWMQSCKGRWRGFSTTSISAGIFGMRSSVPRVKRILSLSLLRIVKSYELGDLHEVDAAARVIGLSPKH